MPKKKRTVTLGFDDPKMARHYWVTQALEHHPITPKIRKQILKHRPVEELVGLLSNHNEKTRGIAMELLWMIWSHDGGTYATRLIDKGTKLMEENKYVEALDVFNEIVNKYPEFAEGYNKRATVYYLMGHFEKSVRDCEVVLKLNPVHFGALHGLGLCLMQMKAYHRAIQTFERALKIQPYADANHQCITYCKLKLSQSGEDET